MGKPTQAQLKHLLNYDPETGVFTWKNPKSTKMKPGQRAGNLHHKGYIRIKINGQEYWAHQLAVIYMTGHCGLYDHINNVRHDNRWCNLRPCTPSQNAQNSLSKNKYGYRGISYNTSKNRWKAKIRAQGKRYYSRDYKTKEEAARAYNQMALKWHGEFAILNEVKDVQTNLAT